MPRDGAKVRSFLKKASAKRSTIKCVRHPGQKRSATNQNHNSRARAAVVPACEEKFKNSHSPATAARLSGQRSKRVVLGFWNWTRMTALAFVAGRQTS